MSNNVSNGFSPQAWDWINDLAKYQPYQVIVVNPNSNSSVMVERIFKERTSYNKRSIVNLDTNVTDFVFFHDSSKSIYRWASRAMTELGVPSYLYYRDGDFVYSTPDNTYDSECKFQLRSIPSFFHREITVL